MFLTVGMPENKFRIVHPVFFTKEAIQIVTESLKACPRHQHFCKIVLTQQIKVPLYANNLQFRLTYCLQLSSHSQFNHFATFSMNKKSSLSKASSYSQKFQLGTLFCCNTHFVIKTQSNNNNNPGFQMYNTQFLDKL